MIKIISKLAINLPAGEKFKTNLPVFSKKATKYTIEIFNLRNEKVVQEVTLPTYEEVIDFCADFNRASQPW